MGEKSPQERNAVDDVSDGDALLCRLSAVVVRPIINSGPLIGDASHLPSDCCAHVLQLRNALK
jgi:hypothetical protein